MANMSTIPNPSLDSALASIPKKFRSRIITAYLDLKRRYREALFDSAWDASGLSAGKFCESVIRFLQHELTGTSVAFGKHIPNFADECRKLIVLPKTSGHESLRVILPRALVFLYTLRGKRGIGHAGGDVEANEIDAATTVRICDWMVCELIRIYHKLSLEEAQAIVDALAERNMPEIWEVAGKKRVLRKDLTYKQQVLILLYSESAEGVFSEDLFQWTEHSHRSTFTRDVLVSLHKDRLVEYDRENQILYISPVGVQEVEENLLKSSGGNETK